MARRGRPGGWAVLNTRGGAASEASRAGPGTTATLAGLDGSWADSETHRRYNPLTGRWVLVSPGRDRRPWQGSREAVASPDVPGHDPDCHLCPGNVRAGGARNPGYEDTFVFTNDFPALRPASRPAGPLEQAMGAAGGVAGRLLRAEAEPGTCRVICFSPRHDASLGSLPHRHVRAVVDTWAQQERELGRDWRWVQVFENRGALMGASSPHPHGQVWATASLPDEPAAEDTHQRAYFARHGVALLSDYAELEAARGERVVFADEHWLAVVPFWAVWPFETMLLPQRPVARLADLTDPERDGLATALRRLLGCYDAVFDVPFPYSMGWHGAPGPWPAGGPSAAGDHWQLHAHFYPPLLRSPTVRKFLVGFELLAGVQRDVTPEAAAARLRACLPTPYVTARMDAGVGPAGPEAGR
ncbi:UDP-glucose--hexose-1-phosphate uridylyltransferase [Pseudofrankia inefficax]|uniref:Galactose-1-phosphate uridylyltransferase n=1 Tax=Pseudofrankia inefficax (strain DSM 45817 / CECT 9037 / DDB 130130 / EuI1c) TaxID=298654 RepID=E3IUF0_PSEI1|nr:UDP-glucose--hexose-1-phosphate uridylyltransferase [Pseudofrankia inefficax]ADP83635.1 galactose-1-phosphate uridylyltransferase [Pseudofrankia inefficax]